jgi:hypothetical protein
MLDVPLLSSLSLSLESCEQLSGLELLDKASLAKGVSRIGEASCSAFTRWPWLLGDVLFALPYFVGDGTAPCDRPLSAALFWAQVLLFIRSFADFLGALRSYSVGPSDALVNGGEARGVSLEGERRKRAEGECYGMVAPEQGQFCDEAHCIFSGMKIKSTEWKEKKKSADNLATKCR